MPLKPNERLLIGKDPEEAARLAADCVLEALAGPSTPKSVALAGGSTPKVLYSTLASPPYREAIPWHDTHWFWGDERFVPHDHPDSNFRMAREELLLPAGLAADGVNVHPMPASKGDFYGAAVQYEQLIRDTLPSGRAAIPSFDLILLGVGADGHTASLFPGTAALAETERWVVANHIPVQNTWRMTMTFPLLLAARQIVFFVTGGGKAEVMRRLLSAAGAGWPAARLREAKGRITWVLDAAASPDE